MKIPILKNFKYAFKGFQWVWEGIVFRIQLLIGILALLFAWYLHLSATDWILLLFTIFIVLIAEIINTSIEHSCDAITQERNQHIMKAKDVAAAASLLASILSIIIGLILFLPYLIPL